MSSDAMEMPDSAMHSQIHRACAGPVTANGKVVLRRLLERLTDKLPPDEWTSEVVAAHSSLIAALEEATAQTETCQRYERLIRSYHDNMTAMTAQHTGAPLAHAQ